MTYALGKYANAICDRCGQQYPYLTLKKEWTGFKVCIECYEPKHPQLEPKRNISDPQALLQPRPDAPAGIDVYAGAPGDSAFTSTGMQPNTNNALIGGGSVGTVTVTTS